MFFSCDKGEYKPIYIKSVLVPSDVFINQKVSVLKSKFNDVQNIEEGCSFEDSISLNGVNKIKRHFYCHKYMALFNSSALDYIGSFSITIEDTLAFEVLKNEINHNKYDIIEVNDSILRYYANSIEIDAYKYRKWNRVEIHYRKVPN